ncbi:hypothetical protein C8J57DRAFT_1518176 [Mycena rebaudengoi]|nr:hypothetical protein C8J57DRAFT_1518176 [Mycena rebaudengoi]
MQRVLPGGQSSDKAEVCETEPARETAVVFEQNSIPNLVQLTLDPGSNCSPDATQLVPHLDTPIGPVIGQNCSPELALSISYSDVPPGKLLELTLDSVALREKMPTGPSDTIPVPDLLQNLDWDLCDREVRDYLRCMFQLREYEMRPDVKLLLVALVNSVFEVYQVYMDAILDHARKPSQELKAEDLVFTVDLRLKQVNLKDFIGLSSRVEDTRHDGVTKAQALKSAPKLDEYVTMSGRTIKPSAARQEAEAAKKQMAEARKKKTRGKDTAEPLPPPPPFRWGEPPSAGESLRARVRSMNSKLHQEPSSGEPLAVSLHPDSSLVSASTAPIGNSQSDRFLAEGSSHAHPILSAGSSLSVSGLDSEQIQRGRYRPWNLMARRSPLGGPSPFSSSRKAAIPRGLLSYPAEDDTCSTSTGGARAVDVSASPNLSVPLQGISRDAVPRSRNHYHPPHLGSSHNSVLSGSISLPTEHDRLASASTATTASDRPRTSSRLRARPGPPVSRQTAHYRSASTNIVAAPPEVDFVVLDESGRKNKKQRTK